MTAPTRRVRRLRLSAPEPGLIQQGATLFEDALRVAELPEGDSGRLLLIRDLDVGTIELRRGVVRLAQRLTERVRASGVAARYGGDSEADSSSAVFFLDRTDAAVLLVERLARSRATEAWFWPLAVPAWRRGADRSTGLRSALLAAVELAGGVAAVSALMVQLATDAAIAPLLQSLRPGDGDTLLRTCGWPARREISRPLGAPRNPEVRQPLRSSSEAALDLAIDSWGRDDPRSLWLACALRVGEYPDVACDPGLASDAAHLVAAAVRRQAVRGAAEPAATEPHPAPGARPPRHPSRRSLRSAEPDDRRSDLRPSAQRETTAGAGAPTSRPETGSHASDSPGDPLPVRYPQDPAALPDCRDDTFGESSAAGTRAWAGEPTALAGLLFLLAVLRNLGIEGFLEAHPKLRPWAIPARALRLLARRLGASDDDPLLAIVSAAAPSVEPGRLDFTVPGVWRRGVAQAGRPSWRDMAEGARSSGSGARVLCDSSGRLPLALRDGRLPDDLQLLVETWLTASRRWCRRRAGLGLVDLVRRPGRLLATPTHVDIVLDYRTADPRVRRAGLDQDPGWLPWFGRVVQFHYRSEEEPVG